MSTMKAHKPARVRPFQAEVRTILEALGEDPDRQGLMNTPERVETAYRWLTRGYRLSVADVVGDRVINAAVGYEGLKEAVDAARQRS